jgi:trimeric autotransporter adhesin
VTVTAGATGTAMLNLGSINGFNASVGLACAAPSGLTCSLNPASVTVNGNTTATLTINASIPASVVRASAQRRRWFAASAGATLACVFLLGIPARRRKWQSFLSLIVLAVLAAGIGCGGGGGGSSTSNPAPPSPPSPPTTGSTPTAAGTYTVVVTGTQGTVISHAIPVTVIVKASS